jgi:signal transduction histidine kinase
MRIALKIRLATGLALGMIALIGLIVGSTTAQVQRAIRRSAAVDAVVNGVFELDMLTREYLAHGGLRIRQQWTWRHQSLGQRLARMEPLAATQSDLARLRRGHRDIAQLFGDLVALNETPPAAAGSATARAERELQLAGQLVAHEKGMISAAVRLRAVYSALLLRAQRAEALVIAVAIVVAAGAVIIELALIRALVLRPLRRLRAGIEMVGRGNLDHRVGGAADDEIGDLARAFDRMADNLKTLTASRDELNREIDERKRIEHSLQQSNAELAAINKELEAFSYSVSHDLRAPLRSIDGFSRALEEDYAQFLNPQALDDIQRVRASAQRMGQLIDDLLMLARLTRAEMKVETVDVSALAADIVADLNRTQPRPNAEWRIAPGLTAPGDRRLLRIALENMLDNAWKFTAKTPQPRIEFDALTDAQDNLVFYIKDNGAGFDYAYADRLFRPFHRLHTSAEFSGTGVGLATVYRIIARHRGRVWAESRPGGGATFYFTLNLPAGNAMPTGASS